MEPQSFSGCKNIQVLHWKSASSQMKSKLFTSLIPAWAARILHFTCIMSVWLKKLLYVMPGFIWRKSMARKCDWDLKCFWSLRLRKQVVEMKIASCIKLKEIGMQTKGKVSSFFHFSLATVKCTWEMTRKTFFILGEKTILMSWGINSTNNYLR